MNCNDRSQGSAEGDRDSMRARGLTNLSVRREIKTVKEIPKLRTGKVNHRELQALMGAPANPSGQLGK